MFRDTFVKFFLDPDGNGMNYVEIHINPINNVADLLINYPASQKARYELGLPSVKAAPDKADWDWNCEGLQSAVRIQGTLNHPEDIDTGWSVELAVPRDALKAIKKERVLLGWTTISGVRMWHMRINRNLYLIKGEIVKIFTVHGRCCER